MMESEKRKSSGEDSNPLKKIKSSNETPLVRISVETVRFYSITTGSQELMKSIYLRSSSDENELFLNPVEVMNQANQDFIRKFLHENFYSSDGEEIEVSNGETFTTLLKADCLEEILLFLKEAKGESDSLDVKFTQLEHIKKFLQFCEDGGKEILQLITNFKARMIAGTYIKDDEKSSWDLQELKAHLGEKQQPKRKYIFVEAVAIGYDRFKQLVQLAAYRPEALKREKKSFHNAVVPKNLPKEHKHLILDELGFQAASFDSYTFNGRKHRCEATCVMEFCNFLRRCQEKNSHDELVLVTYSAKTLFPILLSKIEEYNLTNSFYRRVSGFIDICDDVRACAEWSEEPIDFPDLWEKLRGTWSLGQENVAEVICNLIYHSNRDHLDKVTRPVSEMKIDSEQVCSGRESPSLESRTNLQVTQTWTPSKPWYVFERLEGRRVQMLRTLAVPQVVETITTTAPRSNLLTVTCSPEPPPPGVEQITPEDESVSSAAPRAKSTTPPPPGEAVDVTQVQNVESKKTDDVIEEKMESDTTNDGAIPETTESPCPPEHSQDEPSADSPLPDDKPFPAEAVKALEALKEEPCVEEATPKDGFSCNFCKNSAFNLTPCKNCPRFDMILRRRVTINHNTETVLAFICEIKVPKDYKGLPLKRVKYFLEAFKRRESKGQESPVVLTVFKEKYVILTWGSAEWNKWMNRVIGTCSRLPDHTVGNGCKRKTVLYLPEPCGLLPKSPTGVCVVPAEGRGKWRRCRAYSHVATIKESIAFSDFIHILKREYVVKNVMMIQVMNTANEPLLLNAGAPLFVGQCVYDDLDIDLVLKCLDTPMPLYVSEKFTPSVARTLNPPKQTSTCEEINTPTTTPAPARSEKMKPKTISATVPTARAQPETDCLVCTNPTQHYKCPSCSAYEVELTGHRDEGNLWLAEIKFPKELEGKEIGTVKFFASHSNVLGTLVSSVYDDKYICVSFAKVTGRHRRGMNIGTAQILFNVPWHARCSNTRPFFAAKNEKLLPGETRSLALNFRPTPDQADCVTTQHLQGVLHYSTKDMRVVQGYFPLAVNQSVSVTNDGQSVIMLRGGMQVFVTECMDVAAKVKELLSLEAIQPQKVESAPKTGEDDDVTVVADDDIEIVDETLRQPAENTSKVVPAFPSKSTKSASPAPSQASPAPPPPTPSALPDVIMESVTPATHPAPSKPLVPTVKSIEAAPCTNNECTSTSFPFICPTCPQYRLVLMADTALEKDTRKTVLCRVFGPKMDVFDEAPEFLATFGVVPSVKVFRSVWKITFLANAAFIFCAIQSDCDMDLDAGSLVAVAQKRVDEEDKYPTGSFEVRGVGSTVVRPGEFAKVKGRLEVDVGGEKETMPFNVFRFVSHHPSLGLDETAAFQVDENLECVVDVTSDGQVKVDGNTVLGKAQNLTNRQSHLKDLIRTATEAGTQCIGEVEEACFVIAKHSASALGGGTASVLGQLKNRTVAPEGELMITGIRTSNWKPVERRAEEIVQGAIVKLKLQNLGSVTKRVEDGDVIAMAKVIRKNPYTVVEECLVGNLVGEFNRDVEPDAMTEIPCYVMAPVDKTGEVEVVGEYSNAKIVSAIKKFRNDASLAFMVQNTSKEMILKGQRIPLAIVRFVK